MAATTRQHLQAGRLAALNSGAYDPPVELDVPRAATKQTPPTRHCWVETSDHRNATAALLLGWDQREDGWWGLVAFARLDDDAVITVTRWLPADRLRQGRLVLVTEWSIDPLPTRHRSSCGSLGDEVTRPPRPEP